MRHFIAFISFLAALLGARALADLVPVWSTGVAVPGEKVILYVIDTEGQAGDPIRLDGTPTVAHASVKALQPRAGVNPLDPQRGIVSIAVLQVTPDAPGELKVENLAVVYQSGRKEKVEAPSLPVVATSEIKWYNSPVSYGVLWHSDTAEPYVNQPVKAALKLFLPSDVVAPYPPELKPMGVSVNGIQPAVQGIVEVVHRQNIPTPVAYAKRQSWKTADFIAEFTPFREGKQGVSASALLVQPMGFAVRMQQSVELPTFSISALPLPPGAPADFANTVGQYSISAKTDSTTLAMHEPVNVDITVRGTGNLANLECPKPVDAENWKLIPATRKPLLDSNGETIGMTFSQLMRPTSEVDGIPAFSFSYFDPAAMEYKRAETRPIPLPWRMTDDAGSGLQDTTGAPPPAGEVPVEEMRDIYGFVANGGGSWLRLPRWLWALLYLPALILLLVQGARFLRTRLAAGAEKRARDRELGRIARAETGLDFLKGIGGFIESQVPTEALTPELLQILARRDEEAFRPGASVKLAPEERSGMLQQVRRALAKLAGTTALLLLALAPAAWGQAEPLAQAEKAYQSQQFSVAKSHLESLIGQEGTNPALIYYNLGNCHYRLKEPGLAALAYARALREDPGLREARANLDFVQRQQGAILPQRQTAADAVFTFFSPQQLWVGTIAATALLALCLALQLARRGKPRPWLHASTALALALSLGCAANWVYHLTRETPDFASLPPENLVYVVQKDTARSAADEEGSPVVDLTPSSPALLLAKRGSWSYVETAMGTRGWVKSESLKPLCPEGATPRIPVTLHF